jgi:predicted transcriptional regulator
LKPSSLTVSSEKMVALTGRITAAYLRGNVLPAADIASVIGIVYSSLLNPVQPAPQQQEETQKPAVPIRKSVMAEYIVCLEDGRKLKMLKRHLSATYAMTPDQYRAKWNLLADYPMVAPAYAEKRSDLAKSNGLGRRHPEPEPQPVPAPKKRSRPKATARSFAHRLHAPFAIGILPSSVAQVGDLERFPHPAEVIGRMPLGLAAPRCTVLQVLQPLHHLPAPRLGPGRLLRALAVQHRDRARHRS